MSGAAKEFMNYMSALSEEAYAAGWMQNLEYDLWQAVIEGPRPYGQLAIGERHITKLKALSNRCDGWIMFDLDGAEDEIFVPMQQWLQTYQQRMKSIKKKGESLLVDC